MKQLETQRDNRFRTRRPSRFALLISLTYRLIAEIIPAGTQLKWAHKVTNGIRPSGRLRPTLHAGGDSISRSAVHSGAFSIVDPEIAFKLIQQKSIKNFQFPTVTLNLVSSTGKFGNTYLSRDERFFKDSSFDQRRKKSPSSSKIRPSARDLIKTIGFRANLLNFAILILQFRKKESLGESLYERHDVSSFKRELLMEKGFKSPPSLAFLFVSAYMSSVFFKRVILLSVQQQYATFRFHY